LSRFAVIWNAAGVFYPDFGIFLSPVAAAMALSSVGVIDNAPQPRKAAIG
jgi:hypothetical protein